MSLSSGISQKMQPDLPRFDPFSDYTEIHIVTRTLVGVAFEAKRLKITDYFLPCSSRWAFTASSAYPLAWITWPLATCAWCAAFS